MSFNYKKQSFVFRLISKLNTETHKHISQIATISRSGVAQDASVWHMTQRRGTISHRSFKVVCVCVCGASTAMVRHLQTQRHIPQQLSLISELVI